MTNNTERIEQRQSKINSNSSFSEEDYQQCQARAEELEQMYEEEDLPSGFYFDSKGWLVYQADPKGEAPPIRICSRLEIIARTRSLEYENHGRLLRFPDQDGHIHEWAMPMGLLAGDGAAIRQALLSKGLLIDPGKKGRDLLGRYIMETRPKKILRCVEQTGWDSEKSGFVFQDGAIGCDGSEPLILQSSAMLSIAQANSGSLDDWQKLASLCRGNSRLLFSVSLGFAPPLLRLVGIESGGFHLRGQSSSGKTTCLLAAVSVWGRSDYLQHWRATTNGLEGIAAAYNDCLLCLDEMAQADSIEVGRSSYMLANGVGKSRLDKTGNSQQRKEWNILFLSSGEVSLSDHMALGKQSIKAGQEIRVLDIPADNKIYGCFEELHGYRSGKEFSEKIAELSKAYFGMPSRKFISSLLKEKPAVVSLVKGLMEAMSKQFLHPTASAQVGRAFKRFALVAAAGELATTYGITGWSEGDATQGVFTCFQEWLNARGSAGPQEELRVLSNIRYFFEVHGESRFSLWQDPMQDQQWKTINRAGFRKKSDHGEEFFVLREVFKRELCAGNDPTFVAQVCLKNGLLLPDPKGGPTRAERLPGFSNSQRVYRFTSKVLEGEE
jgi:putative DNA primase/helicase